MNRKNVPRHGRGHHRCYSVARGRPVRGVTAAGRAGRIRISRTLPLGVVFQGQRMAHDAGYAGDDSANDRPAQRHGNQADPSHARGDGPSRSRRRCVRRRPDRQELERRTAEVLGKEAALFMPSGTMANQLAIRGHTEPGDEILVEANAHLYYYESGAPAVLSGVMCRCLERAAGHLHAVPTLKPRSARRPAFPAHAAGVPREHA